MEKPKKVRNKKQEQPTTGEALLATITTVARGLEHLLVLIERLTAENFDDGVSELAGIIVDNPEFTKRLLVNHLDMVCNILVEQFDFSPEQVATVRESMSKHELTLTSQDMEVPFAQINKMIQEHRERLNESGEEQPT